jgi:hypothetical protein
LEKDQAMPTWKRTFGFHPMTAWADHGQGGNGEPLAIVLRPGNAGSNTAADHIEATRLSLAQLTRRLRRRVPVRAGPAGGTHEFLEWLTARSRRLHYSAGMTITGDMQAAIGKVPADAWTPAYDGDGEIQDGAWVADITGLLDLSSWPAGMRVIVRKERPHPGCPALSLAWAETDSLSADRCRCPGSLVSAVGVVYPTGQTSVHRQAMVDSSVLTL